MPRALFDVNALIALVDPNHIFHERNHRWWAENHGFGWAICPLVENGVLRIMSQPAYSSSRQFRISELVETFQTFRAATNWEFWADDWSLMDGRIFESRWLVGHRQITDSYLLALAVHRGGRLVTFDGQIPTAAVRGAESDHLVLP